MSRFLASFSTLFLLCGCHEVVVGEHIRFNTGILIKTTPDSCLIIADEKTPPETLKELVEFCEKMEEEETHHAHR